MTSEGRGLPGHFPGCPRFDSDNPFAVDWCDCAQARAEGEVPPIAERTDTGTGWTTAPARENS